jgi:hypothetical protein
MAGGGERLLSLIVHTSEHRAQLPNGFVVAVLYAVLTLALRVFDQVDLPVLRVFVKGS